MLDGRYTPGSKGKPYELFVKATRWMQKLAVHYEDHIRIGFHDLEELRQKLQTVACVDQVSRRFAENRQVWCTLSQVYCGKESVP